MGTALPSHSGEGTHYFVLKGNNTPNTADGYLAFYSSNATGYKRTSGYTNFYIRGNNNDITGRLEDIKYQSLTPPKKTMGLN